MNRTHASLILRVWILHLVIAEENVTASGDKCGKDWGKLKGCSQPGECCDWGTCKLAKDHGGADGVVCAHAKRTGVIIVSVFGGIGGALLLCWLLRLLLKGQPAKKQNDKDTAVRFDETEIGLHTASVEVP